MDTNRYFIARIDEFSAVEYQLIPPDEDMKVFAEAVIRGYEAKPKRFVVTKIIFKDDTCTVWFRSP